ncbi:MAG TPA: dienelactone hydrolase family protein [Gemmatimonadales bacterium]
MRTRAVGFVGGLLALGAAAFVSARPPVRRTADIHSEYVKYLSGKDTITAYLAYPERRDPAPAVIVIHEIFGMSDFVRDRVVQLAQDGFVAIAPDLLSREGGTPATTDGAIRMISALNPDTVTADLNATYGYLRTIKAVRPDRIGVIGFCWGGSQSFRYATNNPGLKGFVVCYGTAPDSAALARLTAPGLGVYAEKDARVDAGIPGAAARLKQLAKSYSYTVYPGVGHGFLRSREVPAVADSAWGAVVRFFRAQLER